MPLSERRDDVLRLVRFATLVEGIALGVAFALAEIHAVLTRTRLVDSFFLMTFAIFLLLLIYGLLSGPGMFLSRPKLAPVGPEGQRRWRQWLAAPPVGPDREFFELVLYTGLAFLLLAIATGIGALVR